MEKQKKGNIVRYNRWGYYFLIPFVVVYLLFSFVPLIRTFYNSLFENYKSGLNQIGPNFVGFKNFVDIFKNGDMLKYFKNTLVMWIIGFIPQIFFSLLLGAWFTDPSLKLKCQRFFKTVIYLPNLIMASAFAMLFFTLFAGNENGPINGLLISLGIIDKPFAFFKNVVAVRSLVGFMNFIMWFGNTTILLMAGMMGIDPSLFEAAEVDGATSTQVFFRITLPLLRPILVYVLMTSLIGGLQMFDVPQVLTDGTGDPNRSAMTLIMYLNRHIAISKNWGMGGALSVVLFILTGILSFIVYKVSNGKKKDNSYK
ncbi:MAG: sugar ABC transporter permease [Lachnospiraceae bacterium]|nr:sugar ABC transporter permease [Lachnospiraceae bacterium]